MGDVERRPALGLLRGLTGLATGLLLVEPTPQARQQQVTDLALGLPAGLVLDGVDALIGAARPCAPFGATVSAELLGQPALRQAHEGVR
ncbi:hypothetical protein [Euzebya sp.]|uniref:hypothetical protein n=1 Tax=Euzebya sp. TaxID=1971409 RepID=UPI0035162816